MSFLAYLCSARFCRTFPKHVQAPRVYQDVRRIPEKFTKFQRRPRSGFEKSSHKFKGVLEAASKQVHRIAKGVLEASSKKVDRISKAPSKRPRKQFTEIQRRPRSVLETSFQISKSFLEAASKNKQAFFQDGALEYFHVLPLGPMRVDSTSLLACR